MAGGRSGKGAFSWRNMTKGQKSSHRTFLDALYGDSASTLGVASGPDGKPRDGAVKAVKTHPQKPARPKAVPEWREQASLVAWCNGIPALRGHVIAIRNEGKRDPAQAQVAKMMGLRTKASDLFIARPTRDAHGLWIEMKQDRKYTPSEMRSAHWRGQEEFLALMRAAGYVGEFAFGWEHGRQIILRYLRMENK